MRFEVDGWVLFLNGLNLRNRLVGGDRAPLQHDEYRAEHSFGHVVRSEEEERVGS